MSPANPTPFSGIFDSGVTVNLGAAGVLTNEGLLSPGVFNRLLTTNLTGSYVQTAPGPCGTFGNPTSTCGYFGVDFDLKPNLGDRLNATGTANVAGAVVVNLQNPGFALPGINNSVIIHADGGVTNSGLFVQAQPTAVATYSLLFKPQDVVLSVGIDFAPRGLTQNETSVGNAVNVIQTLRAYPTFVPIASALFYQPNAAVLGQVYDSLSGEGVAAAEQTAFTANNLFHSAVMRQIDFWAMDSTQADPNTITLYDRSPLAYAPQEKLSGPFGALRPVASPPLGAQRTWRAWAVGNGGRVDHAGEPFFVGSAPIASSGGGFAAGLDYAVGQDAMFGVAGGYGKFSFSSSQRQTFGTTEGGHIAAYGALRNGPAYLGGVLGFDFFDNHEQRFAYIPGTVLPPLFGTPGSTVPGFAERPGGRFGTRSVSGMFEAGYRFALENGMEITPFGGLEFSSLRMSGFRETDQALGGTFSTIGLNFRGRDVPSLPSFIGAQLSMTAVVAPGVAVDGWVRAAWRHEFDSRRSIQAAFLSAPGVNFVVDGARPARDAARIQAGAKLAINENVALFASFEGEFADVSRSLTGSGDCVSVGEGEADLLITRLVGQAGSATG